MVAAPAKMTQGAAAPLTSVAPITTTSPLAQIDSDHPALYWLTRGKELTGSDLEKACVAGSGMAGYSGSLKYQRWPSRSSTV